MKSIGRSWWWAVPLLLGVVWLGARGLNRDSFWLDEYISMTHAGGAHFGPLTPTDIWNRIAAEDPWQAPGYYMLLAGWGGIVGWTEFAARSLSLFAGVLAVAWTYRLGRDTVSPLGGLGAAVALGSSAYFVYYLHELRAYTLYVLFTPPMVWAYWRLTTRDHVSRWTVALLLFSFVGALYTHYFAALTAVILGVYHLASFRLNRAQPRRWWTVAVVCIAALGAFLPWLAVLLRGVGQAASELGVRGSNALTAEQAVRGLLHLFSNGSTALFILLLPFALDRRTWSVLVWLWALGVLALLLLINARLGVLLEVRYMLGLWPALAILVGLAVERLARVDRRLVAGVLVIWVASGIWTSFDPSAAEALSNPHWHLPWRELRAELASRVQPGDEVVFLLPDWTWAVYHRDVIGYYLRNLPVQIALMEQPDNIGDDRYGQEGAEAVANAARVWVGWTAQQPLNHRDDFERILAQATFTPCMTASSADILHLELYGRVMGDDPAEVVRFGPMPTVTLTPVTPPPSQASDLLNLTYFLTIDDPALAQQYSVAFHLQDAAGALVAQADYGLRPEGSGCRAVDVDVRAAPPGEYTLLATVYAWETGARLPVMDAGHFTVTPDDRVMLGTVTIAH